MTDPIFPDKTQWKYLRASDIKGVQVPKVLAETLQKLIGVVESIANVIKAIINTLSKIALGVLDPLLLALQTIIDTARKLIEDLIGVGSDGLYQIVIPVNPLDAYTPTSVDYELFPGNDKKAKLNAYVSEQNLGKKGNAGNYGFMAKLQESLYDEADLFRPQFDGDAYVAGMVFVFGAQSIAKLLQLLNKLVALMGDVPSPSPLSEAIQQAFGPQLGFPRLENLKANLVPMVYIKTSPYSENISIAPAQEDASSFYGIKIEWDPLSSRYFTSDFPAENITGLLKWKVTGLAIYDFDPTKRETENRPSLLPESQVFDDDFSFLTNSYLLKGLKPGNHTIGVRLRCHEVVGETADGEEVLSSIWTMTDMQKVSITIPDGQDFNRRGVPPNWSCLPSPLALFPSVVVKLNEVIVFLDSIEKILEGASAKLKRFVNELKDTIDRYVDWAKDIAVTIIELLEALKWPDVYAGYTTFYGQGGNALMMNQIGTALFSGDSNAPPFNEGTEPVFGMVLLAGSNSAGTISKAMETMKYILGADFNESTFDTADVENAWNTAAASIDAVTEDTDKQISFTDAMISQITFSTTPESEEIKRAFGINMQPSTEAVGCG